MQLNAPVFSAVAEQRGLSNRQIALQAGINPRTLGRLRLGERTVSDETMTRLAKVLAIDVELIREPDGPFQLNADLFTAVADQRGLSNRQIAQQAGIDPRTLERLRSGERAVPEETLAKLAEVLAVDSALIRLPYKPTASSSAAPQ